MRMTKPDSEAFCWFPFTGELSVFSMEGQPVESRNQVTTEATPVAAFFSSRKAI
jgi:hypothetical protein